MKNIIGNHNVLIGSFKTEEEATSYINTQKMHGDECQFEGYYFNCYELLEDGEQGIFNQGIKWDSLKSFTDYKKERDIAYKKSLKSLSQTEDQDSFENLSK